MPNADAVASYRAMNRAGAGPGCASSRWWWPQGGPPVTAGCPFLEDRRGETVPGRRAAIGEVEGAAKPVAGRGRAFMPISEGPLPGRRHKWAADLVGDDGQRVALSARRSMVVTKFLPVPSNTQAVRSTRARPSQHHRLARQLGAAIGAQRGGRLASGIQGAVPLPSKT